MAQPIIAALRHGRSERVAHPYRPGTRPPGQYLRGRSRQLYGTGAEMSVFQADGDAPYSAPGGAGHSPQNGAVDSRQLL